MAVNVAEGSPCHPGIVKNHAADGYRGGWYRGRGACPGGSAGRAADMMTAALDQAGKTSGELRSAR